MSKVAIATTTLYNLTLQSDKHRAELAKKTIRKSVEKGCKIFVVDGSQNKSLSSEFKRIGAEVFKQKEKGMGKSRRQAIYEAFMSGENILIWTEPEKESFIDEIEKTLVPILEKKADMVIPRRKSLASYPTAQQYAEPLGNLFWKELTGYDLDIWAGIRVFKRELAGYFLDYRGEYGDKWDSIVIPVMNAIADGKRVVSVDINYQHPKEQTLSEEHNLEFYKKRIEQLANLTSPLEEHWRKLKNK